jgi:hypothetical protein
MTEKVEKQSNFIEELCKYYMTFLQSGFKSTRFPSRVLYLLPFFLSFIQYTPIPSYIAWHESDIINKLLKAGAGDLTRLRLF